MEGTNGLSLHTGSSVGVRVTVRLDTPAVMRKSRCTHWHTLSLHTGTHCRCTPAHTVAAHWHTVTAHWQLLRHPSHRATRHTSGESHAVMRESQHAGQPSRQAESSSESLGLMRSRPVCCVCVRARARACVRACVRVLGGLGMRTRVLIRGSRVIRPSPQDDIRMIGQKVTRDKAGENATPGCGARLLCPRSRAAMSAHLDGRGPYRSAPTEPPPLDPPASTLSLAALSAGTTRAGIWMRALPRLLPLPSAVEGRRRTPALPPHLLFPTAGNLRLRRVPLASPVVVPLSRGSRPRRRGRPVDVGAAGAGAVVAGGRRKIEGSRPRGDGWVG
jgi:hypothetical protein